MAGETREDPTTPESKPHNSVISPKTYEVFHGPESANALPPGSGQNTAGAPAREKFSLSEAWKTVHWQDFKQFHMYPCVREAGMTGIALGFGVGGFKALLRAPIPKACNWAVGGLLLGSTVSYEYCQYKRRLERAQMKRVVELIDKKKLEKEREMEKRRKERRAERERLEREEEERRKRRSWWQVW